MIVARQVAKRYSERGVVSISLNPGNIQSELQRDFPALQRKIFVRRTIFFNVVLYGRAHPPHSECTYSCADAIRCLDPAVCWNDDGSREL